MNDYVDTPRGYLGHVGSVTVVTHNVLTSGLLPKNMGWSDDGYRDTTGLLPGTNPFWIPSSCCLLYTSDAADERSSVDLGGRRIIKKKNTNNNIRRPL